MFNHIQIHIIDGARFQGILLFSCVPGMALILLVKVQSGVFIANRRETQGIYREVELKEA